MLLRTRQTRARSTRSGVTIVEAAIALSATLLLVFSIFEFGRIMMLRQLLTNAAREGARFAATLIPDPNKSLPQNKLAVQDFVIKYLVGQQVYFTGSGGLPLVNTDVDVYRAEPNPSPQTNAGNPATDAKGPDFTQCSFSEPIGVKINANYKPMLPGFALPFGATTVPIGLPNPLPMPVIAMMRSEANQ